MNWKKLNEKDRGILIDSLADNTFPHTWRCKKHNCLVAENKKCPECFKEESLRKHGEEIVKKGLFGKQNGDIKEQIKNINLIKNNHKNKVHKKKVKRRKKVLNDEEYTQYINERNRIYRERVKIRKLEHSL
jgi:hypothetical protein